MMVRLRSREITTTRNSKTARPDVAVDPVQLYQRYIHNFQMTPKAKEPVVNVNGTSRGPAIKKQLQNKTSAILRPPGSALDMKRSKVKNPVRSKPSIEIQTSRTKARPKTASSKRKPVDNLEDYEYGQDKKVTFEADEIECFFDALKETVEEVVQAKLSSMVNTVVDILTKKIEDVANKSQKIEGTVTSLFGDLNNKITYYGEEHSRHFRYICMKLEYDKIFYQHMNNLLHPEQAKLPEGGQTPNQTPSQESQETPKCSLEVVRPQPVASPRHMPDIFDTIPTCSHSQPLASAREPPSTPMTPTWPHQAGDSLFSSQMVQITQTNRAFNHSQSGPFQRVAACQTSRSCPKQMDQMCNSVSDNQSEPMTLHNRLSQSKSVDVAFVATGNEKVQLGIQEFLDTLKMFQSNLNSRDNLVKGELKPTEEVKPLKRHSALSLMDTDDSSSDCIVSNGMSMLSSDSTQNADNTS